MGPEGSQRFDVYLRTAVSVEPQGWANFDYVKMPDYRWGIFLRRTTRHAAMDFGEHMGEPVWQEVPGEHRATLRRIIVTQGDTEPASVEQQRHLGLTAPSLYDLRNLFQVNVEEGRHLWAMVYLLHKLLRARRARGSGGAAPAAVRRRRTTRGSSARSTRRRPTGSLLHVHVFHRSRRQVPAVRAGRESGFDPLARTTKFMLTEEAHHMFVGETGVARVVQRTCDVMNELRTDDPETLRAAGVIDLPTLQRYINFHYSVTIDLFGADESSNAATFYNSGLKGRFEETKPSDDHKLHGLSYKVLAVQDGRLVEKEVPMLNALNEVLRDDFIKDRSPASGAGTRSSRRPACRRGCTRLTRRFTGGSARSRG